MSFRPGAVGGSILNPALAAFINYCEDENPDTLRRLQIAVKRIRRDVGAGWYSLLAGLLALPEYNPGLISFFRSILQSTGVLFFSAVDAETHSRFGEYLADSLLHGDHTRDHFSSQLYQCVSAMSAHLNATCHYGVQALTYPLSTEEYFRKIRVSLLTYMTTLAIMWGEPNSVQSVTLRAALLSNQVFPYAEYDDEQDAIVIREAVFEATRDAVCDNVYGYMLYLGEMPEVISKRADLWYLAYRQRVNAAAAVNVEPQSPASTNSSGGGNGNAGGPVPVIDPHQHGMMMIWMMLMMMLTCIQIIMIQTKIWMILTMMTMKVLCTPERQLVMRIHTVRA